MNAQRVIDALKVIMEECESAPCYNCPLWYLCVNNMEDSLWSFAGDCIEKLGGRV